MFMEQWSLIDLWTRMTDLGLSLQEVSKKATRSSCMWGRVLSVLKYGSVARMMGDFSPTILATRESQASLFLWRLI